MGIFNTNEKEVSPLTLGLIQELVSSVQESKMRKSEVEKSETTQKLYFADPIAEREYKKIKKTKKEPVTLAKALLTQLDGGEDSIQRLSFQTDPGQNNSYASVYRAKQRLIPDDILKRLAIQDDLVASITNTRASQVASFGRPQPDRHSTGFKVIPDESYIEGLDAEKKQDLEKRIADLEKRIVTCGPTAGWSISDSLSFSQFLLTTTKNAVTVGRIAVELSERLDPSGEKVFAGFRPIDAGTIYKSASRGNSAEAKSVRQSALADLKKVNGFDIDDKQYIEDDNYEWFQVIGGRPKQCFTDKECVVHTFYPTLDVELDGYPVTPLDTVIASVTTHINITTHNRMYFQAGRASRGMLVFKSDDVQEEVINRIKHQFQASINNVGNAWRMPVFAVGSQDDVTWSPIDNGSRDMEFQYLSDTTARVIMSAYQISPEELPGYQHLSRGTNSQALSESNNEYKLQAARDVGIRPLLAQFEDFVNARLMPLLDPDLSKICVFKFVGLDAETPEKESIRIGNESGIHMTYDEILRRVEKKPIGPQLGGSVPLSPLINQVFDKYLTVGEIKEFFFGVKGASQNPELQYYRDPFWMQWKQMTMEAQQAQQQAQQQQQAPQGQSGSDQQQPDGAAQPQAQQQVSNELSAGLDQAIDLLSKNERKLPVEHRKLLEQQRAIVDKMNAALDEELSMLTNKITDVVTKERE